MFCKIQRLDESLLNANQRRISKVFHYIVLIAIGVLLLSIVVLFFLEAYQSMYASIIELVIYYAILRFNKTNYYYLSRYIFFVLANAGIAYGCLYHGANGGVEFFFLATSIAPILFFDRIGEYLTLFVLGVTCFLMVNYLYSIVQPTIAFDSKAIFPYYTNVLAVVVIIFVSFMLFKTEYLTNERKMQTQQADLTKLKNQLETHLKMRIKEVKAQGRHLEQYAFLNAHKVKAPLARLQGLIYLSELENLRDNSTREFYFKNIKDNAKELRHVLQEMTFILESNSHANVS